MPHILSRIDQLLRQVESGQPVTQADVDRLALLQALDLVRYGEQLVDEADEREKEFDDHLERLATG